MNQNQKFFVISSFIALIGIGAVVGMMFFSNDESSTFSSGGNYSNSLLGEEPTTKMTTEILPSYAGTTEVTTAAQGSLGESTTQATQDPSKEIRPDEIIAGPGSIHEFVDLTDDGSALPTLTEVAEAQSQVKHQTTEETAQKYATPAGMTDEEWYAKNAMAVPVGTYESGVNDNRGAYMEWYQKKCAWYGDSLSEIYYHCKYVDDYFEFQGVNCGSAGYCVASIANTGTLSDVERLTNGVNGIPVDAEVIFVMAGTNDWAAGVPLGDADYDTDAFGAPVVDCSTFRGAMNQLCYLIKRYYPGAHVIFLGTPLVITKSGEINNSQGLTSWEYGDAAVEIATNWGFDAYNIGPICGIDASNGQDEFGLLYEGIHFTKRGGEQVGSVIVEDLLRRHY